MVCVFLFSYIELNLSVQLDEFFRMYTFMYTPPRSRCRMFPNLSRFPMSPPNEYPTQKLSNVLITVSITQFFWLLNITQDSCCDCFYLTWCLWNSLICLHVAVDNCFPLWCSIPLYYTTNCQFWCWLPLVCLPCGTIKNFLGHVFWWTYVLISLGIYQIVGFLDHRTGLYLALANAARQFSKMVVPTYTLTSSV